MVCLLPECYFATLIGDVCHLCYAVLAGHGSPRLPIGLTVFLLGLESSSFKHSAFERGGFHGLVVFTGLHGYSGVGWWSPGFGTV